MSGAAYLLGWIYDSGKNKYFTSLSVTWAYLTLLNGDAE